MSMRKSPGRSPGTRRPALGDLPRGKTKRNPPTSGRPSSHVPVPRRAQAPAPRAQALKARLASVYRPRLAIAVLWRRGTVKRAIVRTHVVVKACLAHRSRRSSRRSDEAPTPLRAAATSFLGVRGSLARSSPSPRTLHASQARGSDTGRRPPYVSSSVAQCDRWPPSVSSRFAPSRGRSRELPSHRCHFHGDPKCFGVGRVPASSSSASS